SANGAIPPCTWQLAHLSWRIGATSAYDGVPPPPWPVVTTARAAAAIARTATRLTTKILNPVEAARILAEDHATGDLPFLGRQQLREHLGQGVPPPRGREQVQLGGARHRRRRATSRPPRARAPAAAPRRAWTRAGSSA